MLKRTLACLAALLMIAFSQAQAQGTVTIQDTVTEIGSNFVRYPQLSGMEDEAVQQKINDDIVASSGVASHLISLVTLTPQQSLAVDYDAWMNDDMFSVVISAKGKLPGKRDGHAYTAATYDLSTGERVTLDRLFADADATVALMEEIALQSLSEELNGYFEYSDITPLPVDSFTLDETGITFWYPAEQFSLISGYSGACQFWYSELDGLWKNEAETSANDQERKALVEKLVSEGSVPGVPVAIGENMQTISDKYRLLRTPDEFPGGRYFVMEDPAFRSIMLISDSLQQDYSASVLEGIQLRRGDLCGFAIGQTQRESWLQILGEADSVITMSENMAYDYGLYEGVCDVYQYGKYELRMYSDTENILRTIQICK